MLPDGCSDLIWSAGRGAFVAGPDTGPVPVRSAPGARAARGPLPAGRRRPGARAAAERAARPPRRPRRARSRALARELHGGPGPARGGAAARAGGARAGRGARPTRAVAAAVARLADPAARVEALAGELGLSERQLRRRFQRRRGLRAEDAASACCASAASSPGRATTSPARRSRRATRTSRTSTREVARLAGTTPRRLIQPLRRPLPQCGSREAAAHPRLHGLDRHAGARRRRARRGRVRARRPVGRHGPRGAGRAGARARRRAGSRCPTPTPPRAPPRRGRAARCCAGPEGLVRLVAESGADLVLNAIVGSAGLGPTIVALTEGIDVALANKESLVVGGELVDRARRGHGRAADPRRLRALRAAPADRRRARPARVDRLSSPPRAARSAAARAPSWRTSRSSRRCATRPGRWAARSRSTRRR